MRADSWKSVLTLWLPWVALVGCASGGAPDDGETCKNGICTTPDGNSGGNTSNGGGNGSGASGTGANGSGASGTGANGSGASGTGASGGAGNGGTSGACVEQWLCSSWETDGASDAATRTCTDSNNCGTTTSKPSETATLPTLDLNYYKCNVEPIMNRKCSMLGCHGKEQGRAFRTYARGRLRITGELITDSGNGCLKQGQSFPSESCIGSIECRCFSEPHTATEWRRNYDSARGFALDAQGNAIPAGQEDDSELIAQPIVGGKAHAGVHLFSANDADHLTIKDWLAGATLGSCTTNN
jgi:hypothetical protein